MMAGAAKLRLCLVCLVLSSQALLAQGSHAKLQTLRRAGRREQTRRAVQQAPSAVRASAGSSALGSPAPDLGAAEFLGSCNWTTADLPGQRIKWHTASSACSVLGKLDRLVLVGDSLTRQLFEALVQVLRGDLPRGALRPDVPADVAERCTCNEQANPDCRIYTEAWPASLTWLDGSPLVSRELALCPNAPDFRMQFFHMYHDWTHEANTRDTMVLVRGIACQHPNSLVYVAGAPAHEQRDREDDPWVKMEGDFSVRHLIQPMRLMAEQCAVPPQNLVWAPMHWMDTEKVPEQWRKGQYPEDILRYNRVSSDAARAGNLTVFDTYNLTRGGATLDGVHVPVPVSLVKLQLLFGMLEARQAARPALAAGARA